MRRPLLWILMLWIAGELLLSILGIPLIPEYPLEQEVEFRGSLSAAVEGTIGEIRYRTEGYTCILEDACAEADNRTWQTGKVALYLDEIGDLQPGYRVRVEGTLYRFEEPTNPGQFDQRSYYLAQNIRFSLKGKDVQVTEDQGRWLQKRLWKWKTALRDGLTQVAGENTGVLLAMSLGDKSQMSTEVKNLYQMGGITHILAISGLHISLFGMALYRFLRKIGCPIPLNMMISGGTLGAYVWMTGGASSAVRAWIMFLVFLLAKVVGRTYDILSAMSLAAILLLAEYPLLLWQGGFLMSFLAVVGVAAVWPIWEETLGKKCRRMVRSVAFSLAIQLTILPVLAWFFYVIPLYGPVLNLLILPFAGFLLGFCSLSALAVVLVPAPLCSLANLLILPARGILFWYEGVCHVAETLPCHSLVIGRPSRWQVLLYYLLFIGGNLWLLRRNREKRAESGKGKGGPGGHHPPGIGVSGPSEEETILRRWRRRLPFLIWGILLILTLKRLPTRELQVSTLDVGQGDCIVLRCPDGSACMIDGGSSSVSKVGTYRIAPFLKQQGIGELETIVVTHGDSDHISGIAELLTDHQIRVDSLTMSEVSFLDPELKELRNLALQEKIELRCLRTGDSWEWGGVTFECLYPSKAAMVRSDTDKNDTSLVLKVSIGSFAALFTGDLASSGEKEILENTAPGSVTLLKVGHHGSKYSSSEEFLAELTPQLALISCGENNRYGHPHREVLDRLADAGIEILRTDWEGAVTVRVRGKKIRIEKGAAASAG